MPRPVVIGGVGPALGESLARRFAKAGDHVALWARSDDFADELRTETPGEANTHRVDVTDPEAVTSFYTCSTRTVEMRWYSKR